MKIGITFWLVTQLLMMAGTAWFAVEYSVGRTLGQKLLIWVVLWPLAHTVVSAVVYAVLEKVLWVLGGLIDVFARVFRR